MWTFMIIPLFLNSTNMIKPNIKHSFSNIPPTISLFFGSIPYHHRFWAILSAQKKRSLNTFLSLGIQSSSQMIGVYNHLRNARYLASMKPFSESEPGSLEYRIEGVGCPAVYPPEKIHISTLFPQALWRDDLCFPQVGYVSSLEGSHVLYGLKGTNTSNIIWRCSYQRKSPIFQTNLGIEISPPWIKQTSKTASWSRSSSNPSVLNTTCWTCKPI